MRLDSARLKKKADELGVTPEQLADAVERPGLKGARALSAVRNWMAGRDHPRCKKADIDRISEALGVAPKDICLFTSQIRHHRGSPRKAKLVADMIRGRHSDEALNMLQFSPKRAATNLRKALDAAIAEAEINGADTTRCFVTECRVDNGKHIKRFQPKDRGRAHPILKRTSHITLSVQERA